MARLRRTRRALTQWPTHSGSTLASTHGSQRPPHLLGRRESAGCGRVIGRPHLLSTRGGRMRISSQAGRVSCATRRSLGRARAGTKPGLRTRPPCTPPCMRARTSMQRDVSGTLYSIKGSACPLDLVLLLLVFVVYTARVLAKYDLCVRRASGVARHAALDSSTSSAARASSHSRPRKTW